MRKSNRKSEITGGFSIMADLKNSETARNLMRAFAGESQARNRYTFAAGLAKKEGLPVLEAIFTFTAGQEKEHGEIFYNHLSELAGQTVEIDGSYPVDIYTSVLEVLKAAKHNEYEEADQVYREFARVAKEEGFPQIEQSFEKIAEIEKVHGDRFSLLADMLEKNQLFASEIETGWMCLNCGHIHRGKSVPAKCPVCSHEQGYFIRLELAPYIQ